MVIGNINMSEMWRIAPFALPNVKTAFNLKLNKFIDLFNIAKDEEEKKDTLTKGIDAYTIFNNTLIFPINGILIPEADELDKYFGFSSTFELMDDFKDLLESIKDSDIKRIILHINSPGGQALGVTEFAELIHEASKSIDIISFSNIQVTSAGYQLAAATRGIYTTKTTIIGSIGVKIVIFKEKSNYYDTLIFEKGDLKSAGDPSSPLTMAEMKHFIEWVELDYNDFVTTVADYRSLPKAEVEATKSKYIQSSYEPWFSDGIVKNIEELVI